MKTRISVVLVVLLSVALLFGCATSGKLDPTTVRTDDLEFWDWEYGGDKVACIFRCGCGKTVTETFTHLDTQISN